MAELEKRQAAARDYESAEHAKNVTQAVDTAADYLARIAAGGNSNLLDKLSFLALKEPDIRPRLLERWKRYLDENGLNYYVPNTERTTHSVFDRGP